jgi:hypothetical protein
MMLVRFSDQVPTTDGSGPFLCNNAGLAGSPRETGSCDRAEAMRLRPRCLTTGNRQNWDDRA